MNHRYRYLYYGLLILAICSSIWVWLLQQDVAAPMPEAPDYFIENFTRYSMDTSGVREESLGAEYLAYNSRTNVSEITDLEFTKFRQDAISLKVFSDQAWLLENPQKEILLRGNVIMQQYDQENNLEVTINTESMRYLPDQDWMDTDAPVVLTGKRFTVEAIGFTMNLKTDQMEFVEHTRTVIESTAM